MPPRPASRPARTGRRLRAIMHLPAACASLLAAGPVLAQTLIAEPDDGLIVERRELAAKISGAVLVGLMADGEPAEERPVLTAALPADWAGGSACVRIVSADGLYVSERRYDIPADWTGGLARLAYSTRHADYLSDTGRDSLGVLVARGDCDAAPERLAVAGWNIREVGAGTLSLLVNSFRADETFVILTDRNEEIGCERLDVPQPVAYDVSCALPAGLARSGAPVEVEINRLRRGVPDPPSVVEVDGPPS